MVSFSFFPRLPHLFIPCCPEAALHLNFIFGFVSIFNFLFCFRCASQPGQAGDHAGGFCFSCCAPFFDSVFLQVRLTARSFGQAGDHAGQQSNGYRWPFGPVGLITPFNFPLEIPALQLMGALFMGNKPLLHVDHRQVRLTGVWVQGKGGGAREKGKARGF